MKALYITSIENFSGKTAVLLAIGKRLQAEGYSVGYFKPVSYEAVLSGSTYIDEDVTFVRNVLALPQHPTELAGAVVPQQRLPECLNAEDRCAFREQIAETYKALKPEEKDVVLLEGGGSLRQGYALGISTPMVAEMLGSKVLAVVKYAGRMRVLDDSLTAQFRLGERLLGVILNRVPEEEMPFALDIAIPFLESEGIPVLGALPEMASLAAISVGELAQALAAEVLHGEALMDNLIETVMVGAMGAQQALSRFRRSPNKAVVTGGDRSDIQLAALETSTVALVLTGNLTPSAAVLERAAQQGVAVLLVKENTMETIETVEQVFGKTRLGQPKKLARFEALMAEHVDYKRLFELLEL